MKKSKILNFLRGGSGGSKSGPDQDVSGSTNVNRHSSRRYNRELALPSAPSTPLAVPSALPGVERSASWKYTPDHTPDAYSINSSPSILDGRTLITNIDVSGASIEKSQSWSGDRMLESATDSGSSRGGTNQSSRAGSCSRTGTMGSNISRERQGGSIMGSRVGSDRGDSTPSSIYDQEMQYTSYTDADGYEKVEIPSPRYQRIEAISNQDISHLQGARLNVKNSIRRSRRPSPRRTPKKQASGSESQDEGGVIVSRGGSVKGLPSINLSSSSPVPLRGRRSPSTDSNASMGRPRRNLSRSPSRSHCRSPNQQPARPLSRTSSRQSSRPSSRSPNRASSQEQWCGRNQNLSVGLTSGHINGSSRSMSYEEAISSPSKHNPPNVPPLWKARSWQQYGKDGLTPQIEKARLLARSRWEQQQRMQQQPIIIQQQPSIIQQQPSIIQQQPSIIQQQPSIIQQQQKSPRIDAGGKHQHVIRQEAIPVRHVIDKSHSWQQSHECDLPPQALHRTYTTHERRPRRTGSMRLMPTGNHPSTAPSPAISPMNSHTSSSNISNQQQCKWQQQAPVWEPQQNAVYQQYNIPQKQQLQRQIIYNPHHQQLRAQRSAALIYGDGSGQSTPHNPPEYVELRDYEAMERNRFSQEKKKHLERVESFRLKQLRPESYQGSHDQFIRSQFPQQVPLPQSQFPLNRKPSLQKSKYATPPNEDEYESLQEIGCRDHKFKNQAYSIFTNRAPPVKAASLMSSSELLHTLRRQLAISSSTCGGRSKSLEAERAAVVMGTYQKQILSSPPTCQQSTNTGAPGLFTPALQALVAEKRARFKRSMGAFEGSRRLKDPLQQQITSPATRCTVAYHLVLLCMIGNLSLLPTP